MEELLMGKNFVFNCKIVQFVLYYQKVNNSLCVTPNHDLVLHEQALGLHVLHLVTLWFAINQDVATRVCKGKCGSHRLLR